MKIALVTGASSGLGREFVRQIAEQGERPFLAEIGLDSLHCLVVVVTDALKLMIEICKSDVVVHRSLVDSDDLHFTSENHGLNESCPLFHA